MYLHGLIRFLPLIVLSLPVAEFLLDLALYRRFGDAFLLWLAVAALAGIWLLMRAKDSFRDALRSMAAVTAGTEARALPNAMWRLFDGARAFFAGLLLLFPGVLSDGLALLIILMPGRLMAPAVMQPEPASGEAVIEGEYREITDDPPRLK